MNRITHNVSIRKAITTNIFVIILFTLIPSSVRTQSIPACAIFVPTTSANSEMLSTPKSDREKLVLQKGIGILKSVRTGIGLILPSIFTSTSKVISNSWLASNLSTVKLKN